MKSQVLPVHAPSLHRNWRGKIVFVTVVGAKFFVILVEFVRKLHYI